MKKIILLLFCGILFSCANVDIVDNTEEPQKSLNFIILEDEAIDMANQCLNQNGLETRSAKDSVSCETYWRNITIPSQSTQKSQRGSEVLLIPIYAISYYGTNQDPNGFALLIGDKRIPYNVIAFSLDNIWSPDESSGFDELFWPQVDSYVSSTLARSQSDPCDYYIVDDVVGQDYYCTSTRLQWNQHPSPYTDSIPTGCVAGCAPIAMSQIMAYCEKPLSGSYVNERNNHRVSTTYNWSLIKANPKATLLTTSAGRSGVANLVAEVGYKVYANYGTTSTGTSSNCIIPGFNAMGYSADYITTNTTNIFAQIDNHKPVYIEGWNSSAQTSGHAWVIEGYRLETVYSYLVADCPSNNNVPPTLENVANYSYYYFNLGWGGNSNGFYRADILSDWQFNYHIHTIGNFNAL